MNRTRISGKEFQDEGYLSEANRRFFHPLGLALEMYKGQDGEMYLGGIWDCRDDPEGLVHYEPDQDKAAQVQAEWDKRAEVREEKFGWMVQPPDVEFDRDTNVPLLKDTNHEDPLPGGHSH